MEASSERTHKVLWSMIFDINTSPKLKCSFHINTECSTYVFTFKMAINIEAIENINSLIQNL